MERERNEIPAMDVRKGLGRLLNEVLLLRRTFVITKAGKPVAELRPVSAETEDDIPASPTDSKPLRRKRNRKPGRNKSNKKNP